MSSIGSTRRMTRSASRAASSDGSISVAPDIPARSIRSDSKARSTGGSSAGSIARSAVGTIAGSAVGSIGGSLTGTVAGSSRRIKLPGRDVGTNTLYGERAQALRAQQLASANMSGALAGIEDLAGDGTENIDGMTRDARELSMIEEEGSGSGGAAAPDAGSVTFDDAASAQLIGEQSGYFAAPANDSTGLAHNSTGSRTWGMEHDDADARDSIHAHEDGQGSQTTRRARSSVAKKAMTLPNILKWVAVLFLATLLAADIYRGPFLGEKYDLLRWRSDFVRGSKNSSGYTADLGNLARRFDNLEERFHNFAITPRAVEVDQPKARKINWFSPGLGAIIAPQMSSPTKVLMRSYEESKKSPAPVLQTPTPWSSFWHAMLGLPEPKATYTEPKATSVTPKADFTTPNPLAAQYLAHQYHIKEIRDPIHAILPWFDIGDCWCAPSSRGKLQLAVMLPRRIYPTELVVEHVPKGEVRDIGSTPKEIELWISIEDAVIREQVMDAVLTHFPDIYKGASQRGKGPDTVKALAESFVPIGRWTYDVHAANHVQSFAVPVDLEGLGDTTTNRAVVRANSNWGSTDSTCLYRVKLHGRDPEGRVVYNDLEEM